MDKLKPVLAQKFWILLGVGLIVSFVGWSMASGAMSKAIDERVTKIKAARDSTNIGEVQNETWQAALDKINTVQAYMVDDARYKLWQEEGQVMEWPVPMIEFLKPPTVYRGELSSQALTTYRNNYHLAFEGVWRTVRPMIPYDKDGIVEFPKSKMLPFRNWGNLVPTHAEVWDAQEDLWLFKALLRSILTVNGGEEASKLDASIHVIQRLELLGGDRSTIDSGGGGGAGAGDGGGGGAVDMMMPGYDGGGGGGGGLLGGAFGGSGAGGAEMGVGSKSLSADFDPTEEFGSAGGSLGGGQGGGMGSLGGSMMGPADGGETDLGGSAPAAASAPRRYIDDGENLPYKTRGFYLSVIMDHRRVPQLLCELTANEYSPFPVEITRVQIVRLNDDNPAGSQRSMGGGMAYPGAGATPGAFGGSTPESSFGASVEDEGLAGGAGAFGAGMPGGGMSGMAGRSGQDPYVADPFMAQVAISGVMTIFNKAAPPAAPGSAAPAAAPEAVPASVSDDPESVTPPEGVPPAEGTPAAAEPGAVPANEAAAGAAPAPANGANPPAAPGGDATSPPAPPNGAAPPASGGAPPE